MIWTPIQTSTKAGVLLIRHEKGAEVFSNSAFSEDQRVSIELEGGNRTER